MKHSGLILFALALGLAACNNTQTVEPRKEIDFSTLENNTFNTTTVTGEIGSFNLVSPSNGSILETVRYFEWQEAENAETYSLEICSSNAFISDIDTIDYYRQDNITTTSFSINSSLMYQNTYYYWRVIAKNSDHEAISSSVFSFYPKAPEVEEVLFDTGDADDWVLHSIGSYADISIDSSNFFGNDEESLVVQFKKEDTQRGIPESDGWVIVTKTIERNLYGTDSFFFNMYYAGHDARVVIRMVDRDNEYWYIPIQVSNNAKQRVIVKFADFVQRTKDVPVNNEKFDYERIKYFEVVFEEVNGDGVLLLSGAKAIKFDNYKDLFINKLNFTKYGEDAYVYENYQFEKEVSENELTIKYYGNSNGKDYDYESEKDKPKISDYGFVKINVNNYFDGGDAIKIKVKYTGKIGTSLVIRIYEEDTDRWSYEIPYRDLSDSYKELIIPYRAFGKSYIQADGKRQFYYIFNLQFGVRGQSGTGTASFKDFEIVNLSDYYPSTKRVILDDGLIEDFENYEFSCNIYPTWEISDVNKDEYMQINVDNVPGDETNTKCGQFDYKADMKPAKYMIPVSDKGHFSSISMWLKDKSVKDRNTRYSYITEFGAEAVIYIELATKEIYKYQIEMLSSYWNEYVIPFSAFKLDNPDDFNGSGHPISDAGISKVGIAFQYYYYDSMGKAVPTYANSNPVLIDNVYLGHGTEFSMTEKENVIRMREDNTALIEDFEAYANTTAMAKVWKDGYHYDYQKMELSDNVSSEGGTHSGSFTLFDKADSPSYVIYPTMAKDLAASGIRFSLRSDVAATFYFNIIVNISGNEVKFRATVNSVSSSWTEYTIGFANFTVASGPAGTILKDEYLQDIKFISLGMTYKGSSEPNAELEERQILVDNIIFDNNLTGEENTKRVIG